jgi:hypothetical protein
MDHHKPQETTESLQKYKFDARIGPMSQNGNLYTSPWKYSFVHNFKVHYKVSMLQALANKIDVSISSTTPQIPSTQVVMEEFNQRMKLGNVTREARGRFSAASYHVTNIEYKESFAFYDPNTAPSAPPPSQIQQVQQAPRALSAESQYPPLGLSQDTTGPIFCRNCGARLPSDSKFCNKCGTAVTT